MKKIVCLAVSLGAIAAFSQNKTTEFVKKYNYKIEVLEEGKGVYDQDEYENLAYDHYVSKSNKESLLSFYYNGTSNEMYGGESNFYIKNNWMLPVTVNGISKTTSFSEYAAFKILDEGKVLSKLDRKGTVNGISCQYYAILNDATDKESYNYCFCIDENNKANNAESLFPDSKVKGLILSVEMDSPMYRLVYKSSESTSLKLDLDGEKMIASAEEYKKNAATDYATAVDSAATASYVGDFSNIYSDPLYSYTSAGEEIEDYTLYSYLMPIFSTTSSALYNTKEYYPEGTLERNQVAKFFEKESKSLVKNLASAKLINSDQKKVLQKYFKEQNKAVKAFKPNQPPVVAEDPYTNVDYATAVADTVYAVDNYDYYTKYESVYKDETIDEIVLAYDIDVKENEKIKEYAPDYCENLKSKIPNFQNKELTKHVHNLTGQICDLYLYNNGGNVGYFITINSMRKSYLEIEKLRSGLSQKDQKSLLEFLKNLD